MMKSLLLCAVALLVGAASPAQAQGYPKGSINLVIPYAPGDATDLAGRTMAEELSKLLKVPVLVINRPGAGGALGTENVAKAAKDGYTILFTTNATLTFRRVFDPATAPYDPLRDFVPLGLATRIPNVLALRSDLPYKNLAGMVAFAKKNPGQVRIGTAGAGSAGDFTVATVNTLTGAGLTMVPFKGASPAVTDALGGHIEGVTLALGVVSSHMRSGALRAIAISSRFPKPSSNTSTLKRCWWPSCCRPRPPTSASTKPRWRRTPASPPGCFPAAWCRSTPPPICCSMKCGRNTGRSKSSRRNRGSSNKAPLSRSTRPLGRRSGELTDSPC